MRQAVGIAAVACGLALACALYGQQSAGRPTSRSARVSLECLEHIPVSRIFVWIGPTLSDRPLHVERHSTDSLGLEGEEVWKTDLPATLPDHPLEQPHYILGQFMEGKVVLFLTWNTRYFILDEETGRILETGEGDAILKSQAAWIPLRLSAMPIQEVVTYPVKGQGPAAPEDKGGSGTREKKPK